jgi:hypothetical protein
MRLRLTPDAYDIEVDGGRIGIVRASGDDPELVIDGTESTLRTIMFHHGSLDDAIRAGDIRVGGDRRRASSFLRSFALPEMPAARDVA